MVAWTEITFKFCVILEKFSSGRGWRSLWDVVVDVDVPE